MLYYQIVGDNQIVKVDAEKVSEDSVWVDGKRYAKKSLMYKFFPSFEDCKKYLLTRKYKIIAELEERIMELTRQARKISQMTEDI